MPASHPRLRVAAIGVSAFALVAVAAGGTIAASNPPTVYACYDTSGNVRMSDSNTCKLPGGGRLVSWGTAAVPGPAGPTGATGATGPSGATGAQGPAGPGVVGTAADLAPLEYRTIATGPDFSVYFQCRAGGALGDLLVTNAGATTIVVQKTRLADGNADTFLDSVAPGATGAGLTLFGNDQATFQFKAGKVVWVVVSMTGITAAGGGPGCQILANAIVP